MIKKIIPGKPISLLIIKKNGPTEHILGTTFNWPGGHLGIKVTFGVVVVLHLESIKSTVFRYSNSHGYTLTIIE